MALNTNCTTIPEASLDDGVLSVCFAGDVTARNVPEARATLQQLLKKHDPEAVRVDMSNVSYMDSSGLAVLVELRRQMGQKPVTIFGINPDVHGLMKIMNLHMLFNFES
jgi:anti-sigma B factor antagonist